MKTSKERKMDRKINHKALTAAKTFKSRQRRLDNKNKRDKIHAIDPDMKIVVINERTYDKDGIEVQVIDNKIVNVLELATPEIFKSEIVETNIIEKIEIKNKNALQRLADKLKRNK